MIETETKRLRLRKWTHADVEDLFEYASNPKVGPMAGWPPHPSIEVSAGIIEKFIGDDEVLAMELKSENKVIGSIGMHLRFPDEKDQAEDQREIGYVLNPAYWGKGYTPEAVRGLLDLGFREMGLRTIWCGHFDYNDNSRRVIEKCGFHYQFPRAEVKPLLDNLEVNMLYYSLSREEWGR